MNIGPLLPLVLAGGGEAAEAAGEGLPFFLLPEPGLLIWTAISFGLLLVLLYKFAFGPIVDMLDKRRTTIEESLKRAEETREEAERLFAEYQAQLEKARKEAQSVVEEGRAVAEKLKSDILDDARKESEGLREKAVRAIQLEQEKALADLRHRSADLAVDIAGRILGRSVTRKDHERLIEEMLSGSEQQG